MQSEKQDDHTPSFDVSRQSSQPRHGNKVVIDEVGTYSGYSDYPSNQYTQVGALIDMWTDVVEGYGSKAQQFFETFFSSMKERKITGMRYAVEPLQATGMRKSPYRNMLFIRRYPVAITLYIATQGDDLYISWRAFVRAKIARWKLIFIASVSAILGFNIASTLNSINIYLFQLQHGASSSQAIVLETPTIITTGALGFTLTLFIGLCILLWFVFRGYQKVDGDFLAYLREPLHELHADDVASASAVVHKNIIHTADTLGIDATKLEEREPFYKQRKQRRF